MTYSHETVKEVFGNMAPINGKNFLERSRCPSVGIYRCKRNNLSFGVKGRCQITKEGSVFYFKITAVNGLQAGDLNEDILLVLGLTRYSVPFNLRSPCFIIIAGILTSSRENTKQHSCCETRNKDLTDETEYLHSGLVGRKRKLEEK